MTQSGLILSENSHNPTKIISTLQNVPAVAPDMSGNTRQVSPARHNIEFLSASGGRTPKITELRGRERL